MEIIYALSNGGQQGGGIAAFLPFILIMFIIYFLMIRPQTKRQKEKKNMKGGFSDSPIRLNNELGKLDDWNKKTILDNCNAIMELYQ